MAFDQPGFGRAARPHGFRHSVEAHAAFLGRALDTLGIERTHLVAHDFGGPSGFAWAAGHTDRLASAVLLDTGVLPGYRWHALARAGSKRRATGEPMLDLIIRGGDVVTPQGVARCDVGVKGETIAAVAAPGALADGECRSASSMRRARS